MKRFGLPITVEEKKKTKKTVKAEPTKEKAEEK